MRTLFIVAAALSLSCDDSKKEAEEPVVDPCPKVDADHMDGRWIRALGKTADPHHRFELVKNGDLYDMWYTGGFTKRLLRGSKRTHDYQFDERLDPYMQGLYDKGEATMMRLYLEPKKSLCALRVSEITVSLDAGTEKENPKPGFQEFVVFPDSQVMTFRPCDEELFLGPAAKSRKVADGQVASLGSADPGHQLDEKLPVGIFTPASEDGAESCTYDMDLYFDDVPVEGKQKVAAGAVTDDYRHWYVPEWYSPYSGNHHFQMYRYKTCSGDRQLIAVACLEAALHP